MAMRYYSFPLSANQLINGSASKNRIGIEDSIKDHLDLMLLTWLGAYDHSPSFGSALRFFDFYMPDADKNKERFKTFFPREGKQISDNWHDNVIQVIKHSFEASICKNELRLFKNLDELGHESDFVTIVRKESVTNKFEFTILVNGHYFEDKVKKEFADFKQSFELPRKPPYSKK